MLDPFPFPAPEPLRLLVEPIANALALPSLPLHVHEVLLAATFYAFIDQVISPLLSPYLFPNTYPKLDRRAKVNWGLHVVSFVQSCIINSLSLYVIIFDEERMAWRDDENWEKRIWGYTGLTGFTQSVALGYFLWDLYMSARWVEITGWGMLAHAIATCAMFINGFVRLSKYQHSCTATNHGTATVRSLLLPCLSSSRTFFTVSEHPLVLRQSWSHRIHVSGHQWCSSNRNFLRLPTCLGHVRVYRSLQGRVPRHDHWLYHASVSQR